MALEDFDFSLLDWKLWKAMYDDDESFLEDRNKWDGISAIKSKISRWRHNHNFSFFRAAFGLGLTNRNLLKLTERHKSDTLNADYTHDIDTIDLKDE